MCHELYNLRIPNGRANVKAGIRWLLRLPITSSIIKSRLDWDLKWVVLDTLRDKR